MIKVFYCLGGFPVADNLPKGLLLHIDEKGAAREQSMRAYSLLAYAYKKVYGTSLPEVIFDGNGKPYFADGKYLSVSHSGIACAAALSDNAVGVDIQVIDQRMDSSRIRKLVGAPPEEEADEVAVRWAQKESLAKLDGKGLLRHGKTQSSAAKTDYRQIIGADNDYVVCCAFLGDGKAEFICV